MGQSYGTIPKRCQVNLAALQLFDRGVCAVKRCFAVQKRGESMPDAKKDELVEINVGFNQQQRQLIEKIKNETGMGKMDAEVIQRVFVQWLKEEGLL
jgi:hypothetical protein